MGEWDPDEVRRLFSSLEFRSLLDRLHEVGVMKPKVEVTELDLREVSAEELAATIASDAPKGVRLDADLREVRGAAASPGGAQAAFAPLAALGPVAEALASRRRAEVDARREGAGARGDRRGRRGRRGRVRHVPRRLPAGSRRGRLSAACAEREVPGRRRARTRSTEQDEGQLFSDAGWRTVAAEAAAIALLAPVMEEQIDKQGLRELLETVEHAARVGARADGGARGGARRGVPARRWARQVRERMAALRAEIFREAGEEFNLNSPPQLRVILYDKLGLSPGQTHAEGTAVHRRERLGEAPGPSRGRRAARLAGARQAELDVPGSAATSGRPARRPDPHVVQPGGRGDGPALVVEPEPAEHPDPHGARPADPPGVHPRRARPGDAHRGLFADRAPDPRAPVR